MKLTNEDINHAERKANSILDAVTRHKSGKKISQNDAEMILECVPRQSGRPKSIDAESFESMAVASVKMGIPLSQLKAMKRMGCPAFRGTRVYRVAVLEWIEKNPIDEAKLMSPMDRQKLRKHKADADAKEFQLQVRKGEYLPRAEVRSLNTRAVATARSVMSGKASGLALVLASLTGADPVAIEERIKESFREIIAELHRAPCVVKIVTCKQCGKETGIE